MGGALRPVATVLGALGGGAAGAVGFGLAAGYGASGLLPGPSDTVAWQALGFAIVAAGIGAFAGAAGALAVLFRREPRRRRLVTVLTVLLAGPPIFLLVAVGAAQISTDLNLPPVWLAVTVPATGLLGRHLATRGSDGTGGRRGS